MREILGLLGLALLAPGLCAGQSLTELAISAAGGSAAGIAGKKVGEGAEKILQKLDRTAAEVLKADKTGAEARKQGVAVGVHRPGGSAGAGGNISAALAQPVISRETSKRRGGGVRPQGGGRASEPMPVPPAGDQVWNSGRSPENTRIGEAAREDIASIEQGVAREEVVARLGRPAARVLIPEEGRLYEIYYYQSNGETIGTIRLRDGSVESVRMSPVQ